MRKCPYCGKDLTENERWCYHCENDVSKTQNKALAQRCFIATAAYGTPYAYEVQVLRNFRDERLGTNFPGRLFVVIYYKVSPPIASFISSHECYKRVVRMFLRQVVKLILKWR